MTLARKLAILFFITSLLPFWIVGVITYYLIKDNVVHTSLTAIAEIADQKVERIREMLEAELQSFPLIENRPALNIYLDKYPSWTAADQLGIDSILSDAIGPGSNVYRFFILDQNGRVAASSDPSILGQDYSKREIFTKGSTTLAANLFSKDRFGNVLRYIAAPINVGSGKGVLVREESAAGLLNVVGDYTGLGDTGDSYLIKEDDSSGNAILVSPDRFDSASALARIIKKEQGSVELYALSGQNANLSSAVDYRGNNVIAAIRNISGATSPTSALSLVVKKDLSEILQPLDNIRKIFLVSSLILSLILLLIILFFIRSVVNPIHSLIAAAKRISEGSLEEKVAIRSKDEIGKLGGIFNIMSGNLKERSAELIKRTDDLHEKVKELEKAKTKDEAILFNIGDGLVFIGEDGRIELSSGRFGKMLGEDLSNIVGKRWSDVAILQYEKGDPVPESTNPIQQVFDLRERVVTVPVLEKSMRYFLLRANGKPIPVQITAAPLITNGVFFGVIAIFRDVSSELELDKSKTDFVSVASHELRTPLSTISWYVETMMSGMLGEFDPKQQEYLNVIAKSNQRMIDLVNALLNVSRIELGAFKVAPQLVDLTKMVGEVVGNLRDRFGPITVEENYESDLPKVQADEDLARIVIQNLVSNALKYAKAKVVVSVSSQPIAPVKVEDYVEERGILIRVQDDGMGIPESVKDKIFLKLFRADNAKLKDPDGAGLGLYIAKSIIDQTAGKIWFDSEEGKGAVFSVLVPVHWMSRRVGQKKLV